MGPVNLLDKYVKKPVNLLEKYVNHKSDESRAMQGLKNIGKDWSHFGKNLAIGALEGGRGLANTPHNIANMFGQGDKIPNFADPEFNYAEFLGEKEPASLSDKLIRGFAQYAPSLAIPGANLGRAGEAIGAIPKIGEFASEAISQAIPQAAYGATQNENPLMGAAESGAGSIAGSALGQALETGINALRPSRIYKSPLKPKELDKAHNLAEGTNMDLGNIIQNPTLQRLYENKLPKLTGDVALNQQETGNQIVKKGEDILKKLLGKNSPDNVPNQLTKTLMNEYEKHQKFKNKIYDSADDLAKDVGLKLELPQFANEAKKYMAAIEDTNILKHEPDSKQILSKLINYKNPIKETNTKGLIVDKSGDPLLNETKIDYPSLKEANILKGKLNQYSKAFKQSPDPSQRNMSGIFKNLEAKLKSDIKKSIQASGNETLNKVYNAAEENYAKNFSPFLDKDIYKFVSGNADPETIISKFITNSKTSDLGGKLSKLAEKLPKSEGTPGSEQSNLLAYGYLSRALDNEGNFNPAKFATSVKNLGPNQLEALFPDKAIRNEVLNYKALVNKNPRALHVMFNPLTGQVNSDINPHGLANLIGGFTGLMSGGTPGALLGAVAAPMVQSKLASFVTKKLTDPLYRRKFINALIKNQKYEIPKTREVLQKGGAIIPGLAGSNYGESPMELEVIGKRNG